MDGVRGIPPNQQNKSHSTTKKEKADGKERNVELNLHRWEHKSQAHEIGYHFKGMGDVRT